MEVLYVLPDYFTGRPKPCMNGWGRKYLTVNPSGLCFAVPYGMGNPGACF